MVAVGCGQRASNGKVKMRLEAGFYFINLNLNSQCGQPLLHGTVQPGSPLAENIQWDRTWVSDSGQKGDQHRHHPNTARLGCSNAFPLSVISFS